MDNFSGIQLGGQGGSVSKFTPVQFGKDFFDNLAQCRDDGEKIQLFLETAQRADVPLRAIEELLNYQDEFILAMALQSFGYITNQQIKAQLATLDYIEGLDEPLEEIYLLPDPEEYKRHSVRILEKLCQQAKSGRELTRLSAAWTMQRLGYSPMISGKFLPKSAEDIQSQIISQNLNRLNDRSIFNDPSRYKEYIDFWVYAPKVHLFQLLQTIPSSYVNVVESILVRLGVVGVEFVNRSASTLQKFVVEAALHLAGLLIRDRQYRKYQDAGTQKRLLDILIPFLDNSDIDLRRLAAEPINQIGSSWSWLNDTIKVKAAILLRDWNKLEELGEVSVPFLIQAIRGSLRLDTQDNLREQVEAVRCISRIYSYNVEQQVTTLSEFLQDPQEMIRDTTVTLLKPHQDLLDMKSNYILTGLDFEFQLEDFDVKTMTIREIDRKIADERQYQAVFERIFQNAISSCKADATEVRRFLSAKLVKYNSSIENCLKKLDAQKQSLQRKEAEEQRKRAEQEAEERRRRAEQEAEKQRKRTITIIWILLLSLIGIVAVAWGGTAFLGTFITIFSCSFLATIVASFVVASFGDNSVSMGCGCFVGIFAFIILSGMISSYGLVFGAGKNANEMHISVGLLGGLIIGFIAGIAVFAKLHETFRT
ncbi:hypothetical protein SD81_007165 [Tolypothrix campylonemoides VB511288]|nr:hypothetical protein SD81_007165 [Tolypothrix campylonemoides VB511288]